jgi:protein SCO1/2
MAKNQVFWGVLAVLTLSLNASNAWSQSSIPAGDATQQKNMGGSSIIEKAGTQLEIGSLEFRGEDGYRRPLREHLSSGRPTLLALVYFECPGVCTVILNNLLASLKNQNLVVGKDFDIAAVSIRAAEGPELARKKRDTYLRLYGKPETAEGWHFLTGDENAIFSLAKQVGYSFLQLPDGKNFGHDAGLFFITPGGKLARVLFGTDFTPEQLKLAILEAGPVTTGTWKDQWQALFKKYNYYTRTYDPHSPTGLFAAALALLLSPLGFVVAKRLRRRGVRPKQPSA